MVKLNAPSFIDQCSPSKKVINTDLYVAAAESAAAAAAVAAAAAAAAEQHMSVKQ